jgi:hypothetical protein
MALPIDAWIMPARMEIMAKPLRHEFAGVLYLATFLDI